MLNVYAEKIKPTKICWSSVQTFVSMLLNVFGMWISFLYLFVIDDLKAFFTTVGIIREPVKWLVYLCCSAQGYSVYWDLVEITTFPVCGVLLTH